MTPYPLWNFSENSSVFLAACIPKKGIGAEVWGSYDTGPPRAATLPPHIRRRSSLETGTNLLRVQNRESPIISFEDTSGPDVDGGNKN